MAEKQEKIFKPDMSKFFIVLLIAVIVASWLITQGLANYKAFAKTKDVSAIVPLGYLPIAIGALILLVALIIYLSNANKKITVTPANISFFSHGKEISVLWKDLIFTMSPPEKKTFRQITISDGTYFERIDDFFFPQYDFMLEVIHRAKEVSRKETISI